MKVSYGKKDLVSTGSVLGFQVAATNFNLVTNTIIEMAKVNPGKQEGKYVCIANVHMIVTAQKNLKLNKALREASLITADGMPLVWILRRGGHVGSERAAGPDIMFRLCEKAEANQMPVFFFGGTENTVSKLTSALSQRFPALNIAGTYSPSNLPINPNIDQQTVDIILQSGAKIVFVGLGCPKQELWANLYAKHIPVVLIGVGAAFDFIAGVKSRPPIWMRNLGLEWLFRLFAEPRRLWKRYLVTNTLFIWYLLKESAGHGKKKW